MRYLRVKIGVLQLVDLVNFLGYLGGVDPSVEVGKKRLKHLIDFSLLMGGLSLMRSIEMPLVSLKYPLSFCCWLTSFSVYIWITIVFLYKCNGG